MDTSKYLNEVNTEKEASVPSMARFCSAEASIIAIAAASTATTVFGGLERGVFTVGDRSAVAGATVTWWSPSWSSANQLTGGTATSAFKGFAGKVSGTTWCAGTGLSANPPATVPTYLAVAVVVASRPAGIFRIEPAVAGRVDRRQLSREDANRLYGQMKVDAERARDEIRSQSPEGQAQFELKALAWWKAYWERSRQLFGATPDNPVRCAIVSEASGGESVTCR